ncbi:hypothetical protein Pelo_19313 [Pelomyxa schiedti]|nr:hypothetical protein Pelo_19313 [Pelomyxa schiedti]
MDNDPAYNFAYGSKLTSTSSSPSRKRPPPDQQATFSGSGLGVESSSQVEGGDIDVGTGSYYGISRGSKRRRPQASIPILFGLKEREQYSAQSTGKVIWDHTAISDEQMDSYLLQCQTKPGMLEAHLENLHQSSYQVDVALKALESPNCYTLADSWTPMEHEVFKSALMQYGKKFDSIAEHCHINQEKVLSML